MMIFREIDELTRPDHSLLDDSSRYYYFTEYPTGGRKEDNYNNPGYSLISNLKKPISQSSFPHYRYKGIAIRSCASALTKIFREYNNIDEYTLIPIPPSKNKENPDYDSRLMDILNGVRSNFDNCDVRELIYSVKDMVASHESVSRPSMRDLYDNYNIDVNLISGCRPKIILFDDVLTSGAHFQACKKKILEHIPNAEVVGFFIARRLLPINMADEYDY